MEETKKEIDSKSNEPPSKKQKTEIDNETNNEVKGEDNSPEKAVQKPITEEDVGITEYISDHRGFSAIIKQRYSDFIVNEINSNGEIVHLTSFDLPQQEKVCETKLFETDVNVINEEDQKKLHDMVENTDYEQSVLIQVFKDNKEARTKIHLAIREHYALLESSTVDGDNGKSKVIKVIYPKSKAKRDSRWAASRPKYCKFVLYKENKDTMDTISLISKNMRLNANLFSYAGTKDKRAKTTQEITVFKVEAERIKSLNDILRNMGFGNFQYVSSPLRLGQAKGNHFTIVLRNVEAENEVIEKAVKSLKSKGFINYFGMQRFGTTTISTHDIGRAILLGNYELAVDLLLRPRDGDDESMVECRKIWQETKDSKEMLKKLPPHHSIEQNVLYVLSKHGANMFYNALQAIPRNTRLLYVHSYQSYIWNTVVSKRIQLYGFNITEGDLKETPIFISKDNIDKYTIYDVVLPLPGYNMVYPQNNIGECYKEMLLKDSIELSTMRTKQREYSLSGTYRKILVKPNNVDKDILLYNDTTISLTTSDLDRLNGEPEPISIPDGKFKALKIEFSLPPAAYATMALREILKINTSAAHQTTLNIS
ncbi:hypothetical protein LOTGIDRAFT_113644 [Lottia gigantea]|uniref:TRUD domain-containing protein n=1 Tax=Lottia gigantea TaxID=225164 RepID=V4B0C9_LOTGI|nr:hypothetical protein LOTGIDRAFT_113644 [Lottia gigantea]ESO99516.1 hypothetical protein LOTGIDRAFT_113644 [Lottia gigantea]